MASRAQLMEDELDRRIEQIIDIRLVVALERRLDVVLDRLGDKMGALMEARQERICLMTYCLLREEMQREIKSYDENRKFNEFEGNDVGLFASAEYDEDDKIEAVWGAIDKKMD
ncbi:hypothetical protein CRG98_012566 [Punica granatum]|uniref:PRP1 splicing factor N-terminal domain-containing protein n=1 Tax=Punica granatum TaxID=22663 RepID=A0A2I0KEU9_PUNGR|nr:hypothetical protein CRG98_012566 [Punica granatum]